MGKTYDFTGWATKNDLKCSDGRTIRRGAFSANDGETVPIVWNHQHNDVENVLGHALLENRDDGVYMYGSLNDTEKGRYAKELIKHGDITGLSIYANKLKQKGGDVLHGVIREVSLVIAPANPGAFIDSVLAHGECSDEEAIIYTGKPIDVVMHAEDAPEEEKKEEAKMADEVKKPENEKTVKDVFDTLTEEQKTAVYAIVGAALENAGADENEKDEEDNSVKHNVFDSETDSASVLSHSEIVDIVNEAKRGAGDSLRETFIAHAGDYGIENIDYLYPEAKTVTREPDFIARDTSWVSKFINGTKHSPFSRIKSVHANITADEARAKGYVKGKQKLNEVLTLLKRSTTPATIYKKQKLDRDDIIDITDFDIVAWLKGEMRFMLDEERARAALVGDGRSSADDDKIPEANIRPIWTDDDLYTIKANVTVGTNATDDDKALAFIKAAIKARKNYKGSGSPVLYTTEDVLTDCLLLTDTTGRDLYDSVEKLATKLRVREIVTVPVMEGLSRQGSGSDTNTYNLMGIIVNPSDYSFGADKGGQVSLFEDFDIDFNQQKYLIETRCSGALTKPYSAIALELVVPATSSTDAA